MKACNQCGKCCQIYGGGGLHASEEDISWWDAHRPEIARFVVKGNIWMDPESGQVLAGCPWLQKAGDVYTCDIYHDRPEDCHLYPMTIADMVKDECEMIELHDLDDLGKAQLRLNEIMER